MNDGFFYVVIFKGAGLCAVMLSFLTVVSVTSCALQIDVIKKRLITMIFLVGVLSRFVLFMVKLNTRF